MESGWDRNCPIRACSRYSEAVIVFACESHQIARIHSSCLHCTQRMLSAQTTQSSGCNLVGQVRCDQRAKENEETSIPYGAFDWKLQTGSRVRGRSQCATVSA